MLLNFYLGAVPTNFDSIAAYGEIDYASISSEEGLAQTKDVLYDQQPLLLFCTALVLLVALVGAAIFLRRKKK